MADFSQVQGRFHVDHRVLHLGGRGPRGWGNLGDWSGTDDYATAARALALRVARAAGVGPGARVLDAGCGWGEQSVLMVEELGASHVLAVDASVHHVERARARVRERGLEGRIRVVEGDAARLGRLGDASVDAVVAVDAAYHFDTRARFVREAARVLRPGGRVAWTDLVLAGPLADQRAERRWRGIARRLSVPAANLSDAAGCVAEIVQAGLEPCASQVLTREVLEGFARFTGRHARRHLLRHPLGGWRKILLSGLGAGWCARSGHVGYRLFAGQRLPTRAEHEPVAAPGGAEDLGRASDRASAI